MRCYISGAMRGMPGKNFPAFDEAARKLRAAHHDPLNPAASFHGKPHPSRSDCLRHDLLLVLTADCVMALPGWEQSPGAKLEVGAAWGCEIPCYDYAVWEATGRLQDLVRKTVTIPREEQYYAQSPLVGLSGFAEAGKDEVAQILVRHGWVRVAFADPLKDIATEIGWDGLKDDHGRRLLQDLGVAVRRHLDPETWVTAAEISVEDAGIPVVITDVRFPNELFMLRRRKGIVVRVVRPGKGPINEHVSEHAVTDEDCDYVLMNDGSLEDLEASVIKLFSGELGLPLHQGVPS